MQKIGTHTYYTVQCTVCAKKMLQISWNHGKLAPCCSKRCIGIYSHRAHDRHGKKNPRYKDGGRCG